MGRLSRTARWSGGAFLVCLVLVAATWLGLVSPRRAQVSDLNAQNAAATSANEVLRTRIEQLRVQYAKLPETRAQLAEIRRQLPGDVDMPALVRAIAGLADTAGVTLDSFTPGAAKAVTAAEAGGGTVAPGLVSVPVALMVTGDYFQAVSFLRELQSSLPRAFLVTGLQIGKAGEGDGIQVTLTGKVFSLVDQTAPATTPSAAPPAGPGAAGPGAGTRTRGTPATGATPSGTAPATPGTSGTPGTPAASVPPAPVASEPPVTLAAAVTGAPAGESR